jgi:hypothetical protein
MKKLTVQITKPIGWYDVHMGAEFEVYDAPNENFGDTDYYLVEDFNKKGGRRLITKNTCKIINKTMKKSDLKSGMLVETREGKRGIVMLNTPNGDMIVAGDNNADIFIKKMWDELNRYADDLSHPDGEKYNIYKIYGFNHNMGATHLSTSGRELLFERKDKLEVTLEQIAEKFNVDVNDLKIIK